MMYIIILLINTTDPTKHKLLILGSAKISHNAIEYVTYLEHGLLPEFDLLVTIMLQQMSLMSKDRTKHVLCHAVRV